MRAGALIYTRRPFKRFVNLTRASILSAFSWQATDPVALHLVSPPRTATPRGSPVTGGGKKPLQEESTTEQNRRRLRIASAHELNILLPDLSHGIELVLPCTKEAFEQLLARVLQERGDDEAMPASPSTPSEDSSL